MAKEKKEILAEDSPEFVGPPRPPVKQVVYGAKVKLIRIDPRFVSFQLVPDRDVLFPFSLPTQIQVPRNAFSKDDDFNLDFIAKDLPSDADPKDLADQKLWRELLEMKLQIVR
jgi:hypothetical protein